MKQALNKFLKENQLSLVSSGEFLGSTTRFSGLLFVVKRGKLIQAAERIDTLNCKDNSLSIWLHSHDCYLEAYGSGILIRPLYE